ncbi:MAG: hypothetical protein ACKVX7_04925 [Planctomycetota bacterium]
MNVAAKFVPVTNALDAAARGLALPPSVAKLWIFGAIALLVIGLAVRVAPLAEPHGRQLREFPTEDGYLMLTIARNLAIGKSMSVADGEQLTNGTQPLATILWAAAFGVAGGDRVDGVRNVLVLEILFSLVAVFALYRLLRSVLHELALPREVALFTAAAWFASAAAIPHAMNCLETGLYALVVIWVFAVFLSPASDREFSLKRSLGLGALLGLVFWARNDSVFLILAVCVSHLARPLLYGTSTVLRRFKESLVFGGLSVVIAAPWLIYNKVNFGSIVPISGQSESMGAELGGNLVKIPASLLEYLFIVFPVPARLETSLWVAVPAAVICLGALAVLFARRAQLGPQLRLLVLAGGIFGGLLCAYYGLLFGAGWFVARYMFPLSPLLVIPGACVLGRYVAPRTAWAAVAISLTVLLCARLGLRIHMNGAQHQHFQVVEWVAEYVPEDVWIGSPQSGTVGFYHDRTLNLDGKVNPIALAARQRDPAGGVHKYMVERGVQYFVDWASQIGWAQHPVLAPHFKVLVHDVAQNLVVLQRHGAPILKPVDPPLPR